MTSKDRDSGLLQLDLSKLESILKMGNSGSQALSLFIHSILEIKNEGEQLLELGWVCFWLLASIFDIFLIVAFSELPSSRINSIWEIMETFIASMKGRNVIKELVMNAIN